MKKQTITRVLYVVALLTFMAALAVTEGWCGETITDTMYEAITPDGEAIDISEVKVRQTIIKMITTDATIAELDAAIEYYKAMMAPYQEAIDNFKEIRERVLREAEKVKLRKARIGEPSG